jgi:bifunctional UDP-N-acetylglucosamine pyrophosphorylase / glucosamine-1-phosphate N-acetyltransferase
MRTPRLNCVVLAAGKGTRMVSKIPKIAHPIMGKPMVRHVVATARALGAMKVIVVTGHERETVEDILADDQVSFAVQAEQKGTAHALLSAEDQLADGDILVLYGDVPLIQASTLGSFLEFFRQSEGIVFMTTEVARPEGYGRVLVGQGEEILDIVEDSDATPEIRRINIINTGICVIRRDLLDLVKSVTPNNRKGEYYLTDICKVARGKGIRVKAYLHPNSTEVLGINTRKELQDVNTIIRNRILDRLMESGVTITDRTVYVEDEVRIGCDTVVFPYTYLSGRCEIAEEVTIGPHVTLRRCVIGRGAVIESFVSLEETTVEEGARVRSFTKSTGGMIGSREE